ncbi:MAG: hypothetical protein OHK003_06260 [Anaerolineales bacterium]
MTQLSLVTGTAGHKLLKIGLSFPAKSLTFPASILGLIVPLPEATADKVNIFGSSVGVIVHVIPVAVPFCLISATVNVLASIVSLNVTTNSTGRVV